MQNLSGMPGWSNVIAKPQWHSLFPHSQGEPTGLEGFWVYCRSPGPGVPNIPTQNTQTVKMTSQISPSYRVLGQSIQNPHSSTYLGTAGLMAAVICHGQHSLQDHLLLTTLSISTAHSSGAKTYVCPLPYFQQCLLTQQTPAHPWLLGCFSFLGVSWDSGMFGYKRRIPAASQRQLLTSGRSTQCMRCIFLPQLSLPNWSS